MNVNWNIVIIIVAILIFCVIFKNPLSKLIIRITEFRFSRKIRKKVEPICSNMENTQNFTGLP